MRIKFQTANDLFVAFPTLRDDVESQPDDREPLEYTKALATSETPEDCLSFFAYLAPRREAVWWNCRCLDALGLKDAAGAYEAALQWVRDPEDEHRVAALKKADTGSDEHAATWAALAAGWSGGNISMPDDPPVIAAPHLTAKAVRASILIAVSSAPFTERAARLERCLDEAMSVANDDIEARFD